MRFAAAACALILLAASPVHAQIQGQVYASGFESPVAFVQDPTDRTVQLVVQQTGRIRVVRSGTVLGTDFLNLTGSIVCCGEQGLLGLVFAPDYALSGRFFVNFTNGAGDTVVARFKRSPDPLVADPSSRFDLMFSGRRIIEQPFANHNGGHLAFGPDGFLYIGLGDGGSGNDPGNRAQNPNELLGKMLRIDVNVPDDDPAGYRIPADNPFAVGHRARDEIWAFGLRNPWRYSFDDVTRGGTGALIIGDVGQNRFEEIDYEPRGAGGRNYGWRNREGAHDNVTTQPPAYLPLIEPIFEYGRSDGVSVTGGFVYRGSRLGAENRGRYFFADYSGRVWSLALTIDGSGEARGSDRREHTTELGGRTAVGSISSFGVDTDGELYIVNHSGGTIIRMTAPLSAPPAPMDLKIIKP